MRNAGDQRSACCVYLFYPNRYGRTRLNSGFFEARLGTAATTRNWKTVCKLCELAAEGSWTARPRPSDLRFGSTGAALTTRNGGRPTGALTRAAQNW